MKKLIFDATEKMLRKTSLRSNRPSLTMRARRNIPNSSRMAKDASGRLGGGSIEGHLSPRGTSRS